MLYIGRSDSVDHFSLSYFFRHLLPTLTTLVGNWRQSNFASRTFSVSLFTDHSLTLVGLPPQSIFRFRTFSDTSYRHFHDSSVRPRWPILRVVHFPWAFSPTIHSHWSVCLRRAIFVFVLFPTPLTDTSLIHRSVPADQFSLSVSTGRPFLASSVPHRIAHHLSYREVSRLYCHILSRDYHLLYIG
jgi:hypothetical protein